MNQHMHTHHRGATLLIVMILLTIVTSTVGFIILRSSVSRISARAKSFSTESLWIAEGVAEQWQKRIQNVELLSDDWLIFTQWQQGELSVQVMPSSVESKFYLPSAQDRTWLDLWSSYQSSVKIDLDANQRILESGCTMLEAILDPVHVSAQDAYIPNRAGDACPFDWFTIHGSGKVDITRARREVMRLSFPGLTDAQLSGLSRFGQTKFDSQKLSQELSLTEDQQKQVLPLIVTAPQTLELLIRIQRGGLQALYLAVLECRSDGKILEVRIIE